MSMLTDMLERTRPVVDRLLRLHGGFITGSYAIGGDTTASDIDVALSIDIFVDDTIRLLRDEYNLDLTPSDYNNGIKLTTCVACTTVPVNIVRLHPFEYCAWLFATNTMAELPPIIDRHMRHRAFEAFVFAYKLANPNSETLGVYGVHKYFDNHQPSMNMEAIINIAKVRNK